MSFKNTAQNVQDSEARLQQLKEENEKLKQELNYKKSQEFAEAEIRNKLGLAKEGETVVVLPKEDRDQLPETSNKDKKNWEKWWDLFFGG